MVASIWLLANPRRRRRVRPFLAAAAASAGVPRSVGWGAGPLGRARTKPRALLLLTVAVVRPPRRGSPRRHEPRDFTAERRASQALFIRKTY